MKYPQLVPKRLCNSVANVTFTGAITVTGEPETIFSYQGRCNLSRKTKQVLTADKRLITIEAVALFNGDIAPYLNELKGSFAVKEVFAVDCEDNRNIETEDGETLTFEAYGKEYNIFRASKERNPDGTVNYTRLELN